MYGMATIQLLPMYIHWHFGTALRELFEFWKNLSWFGYHFFSLPLLVKTLFRPIYRINEATVPGAGFEFELFFENIAFNMMARVVGFVLRIFLIFLGAVYQIVILLIGPLLFLIWLSLPVLSLILLIVGIGMIF